jgi:sec-independent protein translocase protein TatC
MAFAAAVITPSQDAFSMLAMFVPLYVLYEISIVVARFVQPRPETKEGGGRDPDDVDGEPLPEPA